MFKRQDFTFNDKTVLGRAIFQPPFKISSPQENEARFVHVIHGTARLHAPTTEFELSCGDSILMKSDNFVNDYRENPDHGPSEVIIVQLHPEIIKSIYRDGLPKELTKTSDQAIVSIQKIEPTPLLEAYASALKFYLDSPNLISEELLALKLQELILMLINTDKDGRITSFLGNLFETENYEFKEVIESKLFVDLSIEELSFLTGLSLSSFKRKFKLVYNDSPNQYIKKKRIEQAQNLLISSKERISDIAFQLGFNDLGYFSKVFAAKNNCSPSEYRKAHA
jgi:AraC-like DNA-binding protein